MQMKQKIIRGPILTAIKENKTQDKHENQIKTTALQPKLSVYLFFLNKHFFLIIIS